MGVNLELRDKDAALLTHLTHIQVRWCTTPNRPAALLHYQMFNVCVIVDV